LFPGFLIFKPLLGLFCDFWASQGLTFDLRPLSVVVLQMVCNNATVLEYRHLVQLFCH